MLTLVSLRLTTNGEPVTIAAKPFPLSTEWESTTKSTYRIDAQGVIRCKRPKFEQSS